ncbi:MAG: carboxypeptidase regulatory-like domain-containing protein, partial [Gemmataceae bacterium]|nr:carboxypeptidase regulatory-like domain-containing protein [Gemmataceae bacterium]
ILNVVVQADGNIEWTDRIRIQSFAGFERKDGKPTDKKLWADLAEFRGPRQAKFKYQRGENGGLLFVPEVAEWKAALDFSGVFEPTEVRLTLLDRDGKEKAVRHGLTRVAGGKEVIQGIVFDDTPPELDFDPAPVVAYRGRLFTATVRATDAESGVAGVEFTFGKPGPEAVKAAGTLGKDGKWSASYLLAADAKGPLPVSATATNRVALAKSVAAEVPVTDAPPDKAGVFGRVFDADAPVENLPVLLMTQAGEELRMERTGLGGRFAFTGLEPGKYALFARREPSGNRRLRLFEVKGKEQLLDRDLILEPPPVLVKPEEKPKQPRKARIAGMVVEGDRPQAGLRVTLRDATGKALLETTTNVEGAWEFKGLEKGSYTVGSRKSASATRARKAVEVGEGEEKLGVELKLFR